MPAWSAAVAGRGRRLASCHSEGLRPSPFLTSASRLPRPTRLTGVVGASGCFGWGFWHRRHRGRDDARCPPHRGATGQTRSRRHANATGVSTDGGPSAPTLTRALRARARVAPRAQAASSVLQWAVARGAAIRVRCRGTSSRRPRASSRPRWPDDAKPLPQTSRRANQATRRSGSGETAGRGQAGIQRQEQHEASWMPPTRDSR